MQWHKAKVSSLQSGQNLENNKFKQWSFWKEGEILKLKKWGGDEETNPMHKIKSQGLKRSYQWVAIQ